MTRPAQLCATATAAVLLLCQPAAPSAGESVARLVPGASAKRRVVKRPQQPPRPACEPLPAFEGGARELPFGPGEALRYKVKVRGIYAGRMELRTLGWDRRDGIPHLEVRSRAVTNSFFSKIKRADGTFTTWVRGRELRSGGFDRLLDIGEAHVEERMRFDYESNVGLVHYKREKFVPVDEEHTLKTPDGIDDAVTALFRVRAQPLAPGDRLCLDVFGQRRFWRITGEVKPAEGIWTPAGYFDAFILEGKARRHGRGRGPGTYPLKMWIGNDADRFPVKIVTEVTLGELVAELDRFRRRASRRSSSRD